MRLYIGHGHFPADNPLRKNHAQDIYSLSRKPSEPLVVIEFVQDFGVVLSDRYAFEVVVVYTQDLRRGDEKTVDRLPVCVDVFSFRVGCERSAQLLGNHIHLGRLRRASVRAQVKSTRSSSDRSLCTARAHQGPCPEPGGSSSVGDSEL